MKDQEDIVNNDPHDIWEQVFVQEKESKVKRVLLGTVYVLVTLLVYFLLIYMVPSIQRLSVKLYGKYENVSFSGVSDEAQVIALQKSIKKLQKKVDDYTPSDPFIIINSTSNRFYLYKDKKLIREGLCSTGKKALLVGGKKKYNAFVTPKGGLTIKNKRTNPIWTKPDWAFEEEGLPIPSAHHPSRFEENVLGDYALDMGNSYMIHGTIWKRQLGMDVTHGCVRLNDDDLEVVYNTLNKGNRVFIY